MAFYLVHVPGQITLLPKPEYFGLIFWGDSLTKPPPFRVTNGQWMVAIKFVVQVLGVLENLSDFGDDSDEAVLSLFSEFLSTWWFDQPIWKNRFVELGQNYAKICAR